MTQFVRKILGKLDSSSSSQLIVEGVCGVLGVDGEDTVVKVSLTVSPIKLF